MSELISLHPHCPVCGESLLDHTQLIDNCPSVALNISTDKEKGQLRLSSVWDSYNYLSDIEIVNGCIVKMTCPHCSSPIKSKSKCHLCNAPMVPFELDMGGRVDICSRAGCKNHFVKLVDFSFALKNLFNESDLYGMPYYGDMTLSSHGKDGISDEEEEIELIKTGTFLQAFCPYCKKSLIKNRTIKLKIDRGDESGFIELSPYLNVFTSRSTLFLREGENIGDIKCFHCDQSLAATDVQCEECKSDVAMVEVSARSKLIKFYLCSKKGCRWHGLSKADLNEIRLEDSLEW